MTERWTEDRVLALTDDPGTLKNGKKLALPTNWSAVGANDSAVWGLCQGSGKQPYQVCTDLTNPAYKCSCPSMKFPCKHVMALLLLYTRQAELFTDATAPDWVNTWLNARKKRLEKAEAPPAPVDEAAQQKRSAAREAKVSAGMEELGLWLRDLMRRGLADDTVKTYAFWDRIAARMVDAQAGGVARRLRELAGLPFQNDPNWVTKMLDELGRLHLLVESYKRIDTLSPEIQGDLHTLLGWSAKQADLMTGEGVLDRWQIVSLYYETEERLRVRRVWLYGLKTERYALLLDFAYGGTPFEGAYIPGEQFDAEMVFYPSAYPQRAVIKQRFGAAAPINLLAPYTVESIPEGFEQYTNALAQQPWLERFPIGFMALLPIRNKGQVGYLQDSDGFVLPIAFRPQAKPHTWLLRAVSGGRPMPVFGEWDGSAFYPLAVLSDRQVFVL